MTRRTFRRCWGLALVAVGLLTACASMDRYRDAVKVTVADVRLVESTLFEQRYEVSLRLQNRTPDELEIRGGSFDLDINGKSFGSGVSDQVVSLPAFTDALITVHMVSSSLDILRLIERFSSREGGPMSYRISGWLAAGSSFGGLAFSDSGEVRLPGAGDAP